MDMFTIGDNRIINKLKKINILNITPLEAMNLLDGLIKDANSPV
jgi:hypothetical protein